MTPREVEKLKAVPVYHTKVGGELGNTGLPLDRWIGYAVKVLHDAGFETYESCQGGRGHVFLNRQSGSVARSQKAFEL